MKKVILTHIFLIAINLVFAQIEITSSNSNLNSIQFIESLQGPGVQFSNIEIDCQNMALGKFDASQSNINIDSGIILSTGSVLEAIGPNNEAGFTPGEVTGGVN